MQHKLWITVGLFALALGGGTAVAAKEKSWEIDIYGDDVDITYVPDGRNDIHVYDHNNPYNDRSYIEIDPPRYRRGYGHYDRWRYDDHYGYDRYAGYRYVPRPSYYERPYRPRYRVIYHNRYRGW